MNELHFPWLEVAIFLPVFGALVAARTVEFTETWRISLVFSGACLVATLGAWFDLSFLHAFEAHDRWDLFQQLFGVDFFVVDELSAPLLVLSALQYFLTILATLRTKVQRFSFTSTLISESLLLATLACRLPWGIILFLALGAIPPLVEIVRRHRSPRVYLVHMATFVVLLVVGQFLVDAQSIATSGWGISMLAAAVLLRSGVVPVHCWMTDLFEKASFGTALLTVTPMVGAYSAMRLVLPIAPAWILGLIAGFSLLTAVYASCMALVQTEARRFFCYLFLSHASLVLVGVEIASPIGLTGALCVWLSVGLALLGFGLTLRAVETRKGRLSMADFGGLYEAMPSLAGFFLLTGLASIGFPGTIGFVAVELLVEGAVRAYPLVGALVVLTAALNGVAVLHAYFRIFNGKVHSGTIDLRARPAERAAVLVLSLLIIGGGIMPQSGVASRYHAAEALIDIRAQKVAAGSEREGEIVARLRPVDAGSLRGRP
jgi:NADH-quinone oxidoreductase subunit M